VIDFSFSMRGSPPSYGKGRFGDGKAPVFYSALNEETCVGEIEYYISKPPIVPFPCFYQWLECKFSGNVTILNGKESTYPDLVSVDESGYGFCQALAATARNDNIHAFHAPSARHPGGTCAPVFFRANLSGEQLMAGASFTLSGDTLSYRQVGPSIR
jgi:hypothetical protein